MDSGMEDSGFDSDHKSQNGILDGAVAETSTENHTQPGDLGKSSSYKALKKTSELQKKIERQRDLARKSKTIDQQPKRGSHLLSRSRLSVPPVGTNRAKEVEFSPSGLSDQCQPLVTIVSDESSEEDEFDMPRFPRATQKEITEQLIKDGYNLDLEPDDEDLDLIPPRPLNERCTCCQLHNNCLVQ